MKKTPPSAFSALFDLLSRFVSGYIVRVIQLPLIAFYFFPIVVIIIALQENHISFLSTFFTRLIFIGPLQGSGTLELRGVNALAGAVGIWLLAIQVGAMLLEWWAAYRKKPLDTAHVAFWVLTILYVLAGIGMCLSPHSTSIWGLLATALFFYLIALALLSFYNFAGTFLRSIRVGSPAESK